MIHSTTEEEGSKKYSSVTRAVVSTVKHLKSTVDDLKNKSSDAQEIVETQRVIDEIVVANSDAIRHMKKEISNMKSKEKSNEEGSEQVVGVGTPNVMEEIAKRQQSIDKTILKNCDTVKILDEEIKKIIIDKNEKDKRTKEVDEALRRLEGEIQEIKKVDKSTGEILSPSDKNKKGRKCRYFNLGYCKHKKNCRFTHIDEVCQNYLEDECKDRSCPNRHPKACKYFKSETGCSRGENCAFSHDLHICGNQRSKMFKCVSCKHTWNEQWCVVKHKLNNMELYFCLNCNDWVKD